MASQAIRMWQRSRCHCRTRKSARRSSRLRPAPPRRFDVVRTGLDYVPPRRRAAFVARLLDEVVSPGGRLVVGVFNEEKDRDTVADTLRSWGHAVAGATSRAHRDPRLRYKAVWVDV